MNEKLTLIVTCGVSGSTKSTWAAAVAPTLNALIVNMDSIRLMLCGDASDQSKNQAVFEESILQVDTALAAGQSVIYDNVNKNARARRKVIEMAKKHGAKVIGVYFETDLMVAQLRNAARDRVVPSEIVAKQHRDLVPPSFDEGFDELMTMHPDNPSYKPCLL